MSPPRLPVVDPSNCFRETFVSRFDPEVQETVRLFGRLLDDLLLERSLTERGAETDFEIELRASAVELETFARNLETLGAEAQAHPQRARDRMLGEVAQEVGAGLSVFADKLARALADGDTEPPPRPLRRRTDGAQHHLRPVPKLPETDD